jgi:hypothetical protein
MRKARDICGSLWRGRQVRVRCKGDWRKSPPVARGTYKLGEVVQDEDECREGEFSTEKAACA